jgi:hypothetical protein
MFVQLLYTQWKWTRMGLLPCVVIAFALPIVSVGQWAIPLDRLSVGILLSRMTIYSVWYPVLAAAIGLVVAASAWREDHRGGHVYALSLPVSRKRFALMRLGAGAVLLALPFIGMWAGTLIASAAVTMPPGLRAYPNALAIRFGLAILVAYALFFAISAGTIRTAGYVLGTAGGLAAVAVLLFAAGINLAEVGAIEWLVSHLVGRSGPLAVFTGPWVLIDV